MPRYNHAFDVSFVVLSDKEDASDVTAAMLRAGLLKRIDDLDNADAREWLEACDMPYDTYDTYEIKEDGDA
jgi:hypothetical protein